MFHCGRMKNGGANIVPAHGVGVSIGSFSIDDGDGSENVTFKMNWRFFKLFRFYSNSVKMSKEGKFL